MPLKISFVMSGIVITILMAGVNLYPATQQNKENFCNQYLGWAWTHGGSIRSLNNMCGFKTGSKP